MQSTAEPARCIHYGCENPRDRLGLFCSSCKAEMKKRRSRNARRATRDAFTWPAFNAADRAPYIRATRDHLNGKEPST